MARRDSTSAALLLVQLAIGYEWLVSGLTKLVHGDFPSGLGRWLAEADAHGWYRSLLSDVIAPHARLVGYAIESAELAVGIALVVTAAAALASVRRAPRIASVVPLVAGVVLSAAFELANGGSFGLRLAGDSFDEGVDLDTVLFAAQLALLVPVVRPRRLAGARV